LAGGIWAFYVAYLDPTGFTVWDSILILAMVILGGSGSIKGTLLGTFILIIMPEVFRFAGLPNAIAGPLRQIIFGLTLVLLMRFRPEGLLGESGSYGKIS
jgi:branched-chain amino acid transport system permease protein